MNAKDSPRGITSPPPGEANTRHWALPTTPPTGRAALVDFLGQAQGRGPGDAPPISKIELVDIEANPSSLYLDAAVSSTEVTLETAAFLMAGYVLAEPGRSGEAMARTRLAAMAPHEGAVEVVENLAWLTSVFTPDKSRGLRLLIDPDDLVAALQLPHAPPSIFPRLLWTAYRLRADRLKQFEEELERSRVQWALELDNGVGGTNGSRSCLYLMAVEAGAIVPGQAFHTSLKEVQKKLAAGFEKVKAVQDSRREGASGPQVIGRVSFAAPSPNILDTWLRDGAKKIGFDPTQWRKDQSPKTS